mgnify:CR=1 FL=1
MLDLHKYARSDERFHLQVGKPWCEGWGLDWLYRSVEWYNIKREDGLRGFFKSYVLFWYIRWYIGNVKCDPTRTTMYWYGQLDDGNPPVYTPDSNQYVMTTTPKEKFSLRFHGTPLNREVWTSMGSI